MADRMNFTPAQREAAYLANCQHLRTHRVDGVEIALPYDHLRGEGAIYYCENCLFCHTSREFFDVDHLVPDRQFKAWGKHADARDAVNMILLCKSLREGDLGCNQSKGAALYVPKQRGLAYTHPAEDMNCVPLADRPFRWT